MKKIEDLLVGVPCLGDIHYTEWNSQMAVAHPSEGLTLEPGQVVGGLAANLPKLDFERLGVVNSGKEVQVFDSVPGTESCFDYFVAGLGVVWR